jgi:hypothetical protein
MVKWLKSEVWRGKIDENQSAYLHAPRGYLIHNLAQGPLKLR